MMWNDDPCRPCFSETMPDEVFRAFVLKAASVRAGMPMLESIPRGFSLYSHPLIIKAMEDSDLVWNRTLFSSVFIPSSDIFAYMTSLPAEGEVAASSTAALSELLSRVNGLGWKADTYTSISWSDEAKAEGRSVMDSLYEEDGSVHGDAAARFAYSVIMRSLVFSRSGGTPVIITGREQENDGRVQQKRRKA